MHDLGENKRKLQNWSDEMKRDWDDRARQDAKWFINTVRLQQPEEEFDATGALEVQRLVVADLDLLTQGRDPRTLRVLELGCGIGRMTRHLAGLFGEVHATDVSGEMIRRGRERLQDLPNVYLYETSGYDFAELPSNHFDLAFSAYVFQHVPSAEIIESNLRDVWRVLKPGGVFKFQTNSITTFDFEEIEKDTWSGASFPEMAIRAFAAGHEARLISIFGAGMQYCWTTMLKRPLVDAPSPSAASSSPRIEFYGRTDRPDVRQIPVSGEGASLTLIAAGLNRAAVDCNTVSVNLGGLALLPCYVGPIGRNFAAAVEASGLNASELTQIEVRLPVGSPSGVAPVFLALPGGETSPAMEIEFTSPQPIIPRIGTIMNGADYGEDVHARGAKSLLRLHVEGLDESADTGNIRLQVGERIIKPCYVGFLPGNGVHQVDAQLPADLHPGPTELRLYFGNLESPGTTLHLK
jgi:SAM-dependent methyltransferase